MAVEKLILRSIYYAVDKIPDKWFHSVPGGYYRNKNGEIKKVRSKSRGVDRERRGSRSRTAREEDFYGETHRSDRGRRSNRQRRSYDHDEDEYDEYYEDERRGRSKSRGVRHSRDGHRYTPDYASRGRSRHGDSHVDHHHSARSGPRGDDSSWTYSRTIYRKPEAPPIQPPPIGPHRGSPLDPNDAYMPSGGMYRNRGQPLPRSRTFVAKMPDGQSSNGASAREDPWSRNAVPPLNNQQSSFQYATSTAPSKDGDHSNREQLPSRHEAHGQRSYQSYGGPMHGSQTHLYDRADQHLSSTRRRSPLQHEQRGGGRRAGMQVQGESMTGKQPPAHGVLTQRSERPGYHDQHEPRMDRNSAESNR